jgi:response regulator NasT
MDERETRGTASEAVRLLLVDDNRLVLATLAEGLADAGYRVVTAESVADAEDYLAGGLRPDLAIVDILMPGRNGLELASRLRELDHIPFILLTATGEAQTVDRGTSAGALAYLVKPVDVPQLVPAIEAALARAAELSELREVRRQLQAALDMDRETNVAIGIVMVQRGLGRREPFEFLRRTARSQRRKLVDLAREVIRAIDVADER